MPLSQLTNGLETTKVTFEGKLGNQYAGFAASYNENKEKYGDAWQKAQSIADKLTNWLDHIDLIKAKTIAETEGLSIEQVLAKNESTGKDTVLDLKYVSSKDNYDVNTNIMIGAEPETPKIQIMLMGIIIAQLF